MPKPTTTTAPNMRREYKKEIRQLERQSVQLLKDESKRTAAFNKKSRTIRADADRAVENIQRNANCSIDKLKLQAGRDGKISAKLLCKFGARIQILRGRLS